MLRRKKNLYYLLTAIGLYLVICYIYNNYIISKNQVEVLILSKNLNRGETLKSEYFEKVQIKSGSQTLIDAVVIKQFNTQNLITDKVINGNYSKGQILLESMLIQNSQYIKAQDSKEIISINISTSEDFVSYKVEKGCLVNIYYNGKATQATPILKKLNKAVEVSGNEYDSVASCKLFENIKVVDILDKYGNSIDYSKKNKSNDSILPSSIMIEIDSIDVLNINNLKGYGKFSLSILG